MKVNIERESKELKELVAQYEAESFIGFFAYFTRQLRYDESGGVFDKFESRLKDFQHLINLKLSTFKEGEIIFQLDEKIIGDLADRIKKIKTAYNENSINDWELLKNISYGQKALIHAFTFNNYFHNGELTYVEQDIEIFESTFKPFEDLIECNFGFNIQFLIDVYKYGEELSREKFYNTLEFTSQNRFLEMREKTFKNTDELLSFLDNSPKEYKEKYLNFVDSTHEFLKFTSQDYYSKFPKEKIDKYLELFAITPSYLDNYLYYTDNNPLDLKPIIKLSEHQFLNIYQKQLPIAFYDFFYDFFQSKLRKKERLQTQRGIRLEEKCLSIFKDFLKKDRQTFFYDNYYVDGNEQDILILTKGTAIIIELKAGKFREPLRDMNRAFIKIKDDFKENIQAGYEQCLRIKNKFDNDDEIILKNKKGKILHKVVTKRIHNVFQIIVTGERFGLIQQDLGLLLKIEEDEEYPLSIYINDLEVFLRALILKTKNPKSEFIAYLRHRELLHERLVCTDELDICAYFMSDKKSFIKLADDFDYHFYVHPTNQSYFDDMYFEGGLLKNELFLEEKEKINQKLEKEKIKPYFIGDMVKKQN